MRIKVIDKRQSTRSKRNNGKRNNTKVGMIRTAKRAKGFDFRIVSSPDSERMVKYIERFDYMPERRSEVLKKYDRIVGTK